MATIQTRFHDWLIKNKACIDKLEFRDDEDGCGGVYSTSDIAADEVFLLIPYEPLVLTDALARQHLPKSTSSVDCRTALILYVIQQRLLRDRSFFQPYLDMIPEKIYTALEFDDDDLEHLRGTNAFLTVKDLKKELLKKYEETMELASDAEMPAEDYTWEMFLWAETVVSSRAFPAHLFGGEEGELVLIPLADMLNHQSRRKISWLKTPQGLQMSGSAIKKGEQVFNNYGPKSNEELLVGYGFCIKDNVDDIVTLKPNFSRDPDQDRKTAILKRVGVTNETIHYLGQGGQIPHLLLVTMRVMAMNPTEVELYYGWMEDEDQEIIHGERKEDEGDSTLKQELQFVSLRNELAMLDLMDLLLSSKAKIINDWEAKIGEPQNAAQEYARIYRQGQTQILNSCSEIIRGMFSALLTSTLSADLAVEQIVFVGAAPRTGLEERLQLAPSSHSTEHFKEVAAKDTRTISQLKLDATAQVLLTAEKIMVEHKETNFGEAFLTAFPGHGWGDLKEHEEEEEERDEDEEMTVQMEQDAIVTCYLVYEQDNLGQLKPFVTAAKKFDYSSHLDEDMVQDVLDLRLSLQETLESVDPTEFDFEQKYTPEAFLWATGLIEALSLAFHIDGKVVAGVVAPRGTAV